MGGDFGEPSEGSSLLDWLTLVHMLAWIAFAISLALGVPVALDLLRALAPLLLFSFYVPLFLLIAFLCGVVGAYFTYAAMNAVFLAGGLLGSWVVLFLAFFPVR
ncbi:hypothetical protein [Mameliella sediminis]|uniref:hypothetical protein n=1 Tax=Mameliella sediminis TaxID=2836866 RepID=UPI001C490FB1|nr:hypothetical protein [Mameliella sediminis]MBV7396663.1 hypothetical protein [Mameliella sediminis]